MSAPSEEFVFDDLEPQEKRVQFRGKQCVELFVVRECSDSTYRHYQREQVRGAKMDPTTKEISLGDFSAADGILLGECLFRVNPDGTPSECPVGVEFAGKLPSRYARPLLDWIKEVSGIKKAQSEDDRKK